MAEKNLIGELDMYREAGIKPNFSDIAKRYGKDRHTVASYWKAEGGRPHDGRGDRAGSFDAHIEEVAAKAQLPGVTKKGIHEWLLHRYPGEDLAGYNAFTQFMRKNGIAVGASGGPEPHPRFETPPGLQLQFDWKESVKMANRDGELFEFNVFAATLGHSRRHVFIRSRTRTTDDLVRCMYATIARLGGVPREWVTDNMSALVTIKGGRRHKVQRAYEFAKAAGFELKLCRPRSPQTKGKVESSNRFLSRLMAYQGDFDGWEDIDEIVARIEDASNSEPNETTGLPPSALFMEEKDALLPVGNLRPRGGDGRRGARGQGAGHDAGERARRGHVGAQALHRQARPHRLHARRRDGLLRRRRAGGDARGGRAGLRPGALRRGHGRQAVVRRRRRRHRGGRRGQPRPARLDRGLAVSAAVQPPQPPGGQPRGAGARGHGVVGARVR